MDGLPALWQRALRPVEGFQERVATAPLLGPALGELLLWRAPLAFLSALWTLQRLRHLRTEFLSGQGSLAWAFGQLPAESLRLEDVQALIRDLPALPSDARMLPWLLLLAPLSVLSLWLHHVAWDHGCLWMLGGLKAGKGWRATFVAEAEALKVGALGTALGLMASLPGLGCILGLPSFLAGLYFWGLRGVALAAWHGCPAWKGVVATILHAILLPVFFGCAGILAMILASLMVA